MTEYYKIRLRYSLDDLNRAKAKLQERQKDFLRLIWEIQMELGVQQIDLNGQELEYHSRTLKKAVPILAIMATKSKSGNYHLAITVDDDTHTEFFDPYEDGNIEPSQLVNVITHILDKQNL